MGWAPQPASGGAKSEKVIISVNPEKKGELLEVGVEWESWGVVLGGTVNTEVQAWPECVLE